MASKGVGTVVAGVQAADFADLMAKGFDYLVFQNADQPSFELLAVAKILGFGQSGQQLLSHHVLCPGLVAYCRQANVSN